jgi:hypothetical protein
MAYLKYLVVLPVCPLGWPSVRRFANVSKEFYHHKFLVYKCGFDKLIAELFSKWFNPFLRNL